MKKIIISISLLVSHAQGWAMDTYNPENGQLTIPAVVVGDSVYSNVSVNVKEVLNVKGGRPLTNFDSYNSTENILTIPSVSVSNNSYTNVSISVGNVLKVSDFKKTNQLPSTLAVFDYSSFNQNACENTKDSDVFNGLTFFTVHYLNSKIWGCNIVSGADKHPIYSQKESIRVEVRPGDCSGNSGFNDCINDRSRHEMEENVFDSTNGKTIVYTEKIFIPSQSGFLPEGYNGYPLLVLNQITATDASNFNVLLYLKMGKGNKLQIRIHKNLNFSTFQEYLISDAPFDKWFNIKYILKSSSNLDGNIKVFVDDSLIADYSGFTIPSVGAKNSFRFGIYNSGISFATQSYVNQVVYFDSIEKSILP